jgi:phosphoglycolate phosphatase-like HAD superfamily hydrolase
MPETVVFDSDGILVESTRRDFLIIQEMAQTLELAVPTDSQIAQHWGMEWRKYLQSLGCRLGWSNHDIEQFEHADVRQYSNTARTPYSAPDDMASLVHELSARGIILAILSNRGKKSLYQLLTEAGYNLTWFNAIFSETDGNHKKPDPRSLSEVLTRLGVNSEKGLSSSVYIGDLVDYDAKMALTHDPPIKFIGRVTQLQTKSDFINAGVPNDHIFSTTEELAMLLL